MPALPTDPKTAAPGLDADVSRRAAVRLGGAGLAALLLAARARRGTAQEATPAAPGGIEVEVLGTGLPQAAPGQQLGLFRLTFAPGAVLDAHGHPGAVVAHVEAGTFGYTVLEGQNTYIIPAGAAGTPEATQTPTPGTEVTVEAGGTVFHDIDVIAIDRNAGDGPLVLLLAVLVDPAQPFVQPAEGTPAAATPAG